jgi:hypothetical protein
MENESWQDNFFQICGGNATTKINVSIILSLVSLGSDFLQAVLYNMSTWFKPNPTNQSIISVKGKYPV